MVNVLFPHATQLESQDVMDVLPGSGTWTALLDPSAAELSRALKPIASWEEEEEEEDDDFADDDDFDDDEDFDDDFLDDDEEDEELEEDFADEEEV